jgi:hypothetical protein
MIPWGPELASSTGLSRRDRAGHTRSTTSHDLICGRRATSRTRQKSGAFKSIEERRTLGTFSAINGLN